MDESSCPRLGDEAWRSIAFGLHLSIRELQIVRAAIESGGQSDDDIGRIVGISPHTVHTHLERLHRKLGVTSRTNLILRVFAEYVASTVAVASAADS